MDYLICVQFTKETITVPYDEEDRKFSVHYRPLWDWALDLLNDRQLAPYFEWDAQCLFKFDGISYKRVLENHGWEINGGRYRCAAFVPGGLNS